jgi:uncharacterized protein YdeI (YjbR/CyaY-like superfamily)
MIIAVHSASHREIQKADSLKPTKRGYNGFCKRAFPPDILTAIKSDKAAWKNYQKFSPSYKRIRIAYIDAARKRPGEFEKRLANFIKKTKENKKIGFGGIEKYYLAL